MNNGSRELDGAHMAILRTFLCPRKWWSSLITHKWNRIVNTVADRFTYLISLRHLFVKIRFISRRTLVSIGIRSVCRESHLGINVGNFLDSAAFPWPAMSCCYYASIRTLSEFFDKLILGIHHESRVEGGEGMPLHGIWYDFRLSYWHTNLMAQMCAEGVAVLLWGYKEQGDIWAAIGNLIITSKP